MSPSATAIFEETGIAVSTERYIIKYLVRGDRTLELQGVSTRDDIWRAPLAGPLFPANPCRSGNGPRYRGPITIIHPNSELSLELIYEKHSIMTEGAGIDHLIIVLRDRLLSVQLELHVRAYASENIFEQWLVVTNGDDRPLQLPRLDSLYVPGQTVGGIFLEWFDNNQACCQSPLGESFRPEREKLVKGRRVLESRDGNRHIQGAEPVFVLGFGDFPDEDTVPCLIAALTWSGSAQMSFDINHFNVIEVSVGVNQPGQPTLGSGKSYTTPAAVFSFSAAGKGAASRNFHRWMRAYALRDGGQVRPVDNNSWEGCGMNVDETSVTDMMLASAELGIELYVLDDGWFGNGEHARTDDHRGLGDWQINRARFPHGFAPIIAAGHKGKIDLGIWFEPEMINPKSELFAAHPEWVMRVPGRELALQRQQVALDVANPAVQVFMCGVVDDLLRANPGIRFVKWDCNANINNWYSPFLGAGHQGDTLNRYLEGYYSVIQKLVLAHPKVNFQCCSAGGGRADLGALRYHHTFWPSDCTHPIYRLNAIWNFTTYLAPMAATCHVTHAGGAEFTPKFRFDIAMMGQLGMEVDPRKSEPDYLAAARTGISAYKRVRDIVQLGDQYRHRHPFDSTTPSLNYVTADRTRCLALAWQTGPLDGPLAVVAPVAGLNPAINYRVSEINLSAGDDQPRLGPTVTPLRSGEEWMAAGIPLIFTRRYDSAAVALEYAP